MISGPRVPFVPMMSETTADGELVSIDGSFIEGQEHAHDVEAPSHSRRS